MTLHNLGIVKTSAVIAAFISAGITAMVDPSIKVAIITGISLISAALIASGTSIILQVMSYRLQKASHVIQSENKDVLTSVAEHVDGINSRLFSEKDQLKIDKDKQGVQLVDTSVQLAHAEGRREGIEVTEAKTSDKPSNK